MRMEWIVQLYRRFNRRIGEDDAIDRLEKRGVAETTVQTTSWKESHFKWQMEDSLSNHLQTPHKRIQEVELTLKNQLLKG